ATITIADVGVDEPDLTVSISDMPDQVTEAEPLTYTLTVTNSGEGPATDIVVEHALPFSFIPTAVDDGDFTHSLTGNVITFSGGSLDGGESAELTIIGDAPTVGPRDRLVVNSTAVVDPDNAIAESDETNNLVIEDTTVTPAPNVIERLGTDGDDTLRGTPVRDRLDGLGGDDLLIGRPSGDLLEGGEGADSLFGGPGNDVLYGGPGDDILNGGENSDTLYGGLGKDFLEGGMGSDVFVLASDEGTTDVNQADVILAYQVGIDKIGLTDGLTSDDLRLEQTEITIEFQGLTFTADSTAIINTTSNDILGVVFEVTPDRLMGDGNFVPVEVGLF
ncbi:MAG: CARDB domain-containing protein, partial [Hormoscilla sp.]